MVDERAAQELYLKAYEGPLTDGGASSVMCSYAKYRVAGVQQTPAYACENPFGMQDVLRHQFGFTGWIGSDYGGSHATSDILVGLDQEFLSTNLAPAALKPLVDPSSPTFDPAYARALDRAVASSCTSTSASAGSTTAATRRCQDPRAAGPGPGAFDEQAGIELARRLAQESAVLLKNDHGVLPLAPYGSVVRRGHRPDRRRAARRTGTERSRGVGQRTTISPLDVLRQQLGNGRSHLCARDRPDRHHRPRVRAPAPPPAGLPASPAPPPHPTAPSSRTQVDARLAGNQTDLAKGNTYTWTGYVTCRPRTPGRSGCSGPPGTVVGSPPAPTAGSTPATRRAPSPACSTPPPCPWTARQPRSRRSPPCTPTTTRADRG